MSKKQPPIPNFFLPSKKPKADDLMSKESRWLPTDEEIRKHCIEFAEKRGVALFSFDFSEGVKFEAKKIAEGLQIILEETDNNALRVFIEQAVSELLKEIGES